MPATKTAHLKLLVFTKEVKHEDSGLVHIEARSGDVTQTYVLDGWLAGPTELHFESALALARAHGEDIEPQPIQELNGGRIFRLKREGI